jgi:cupin fold WbuC family metalloprotein
MSQDPRCKRISPLATRATHERFTVVDAALLAHKAADARTNLRKREIHTFHSSDNEVLQRMLNAMQPGTYVMPHRHLHPPKAEAFVILAGRAGFAIYEDDGTLPDENLVLLDASRGQYAIDIREGVWHGLVILAPDTVLFEVKPGPYAQASDKDFPDWAPRPDTLEATRWVTDLEARFSQRFELA